MPHEWSHPAAPHLLILVQSMYEDQEVLPRDLHLGTFWDAVWAFLNMFCLCPWRWESYAALPDHPGYRSG